MSRRNYSRWRRLRIERTAVAGNADQPKLTADHFIDVTLTAELEAALDEFTIAGLSYESFREAAAILRRSGRYAHHGEQAAGTAYDDLCSSLLRATERLMEAQTGLVGACEQIERYLKMKCGTHSLDTVRNQLFANALTAAVEGWWGHYQPHYIMPADERAERITDTATALSVLRTIAIAEKAADTPKRKRERAALNASLERELAASANGKVTRS